MKTNILTLVITLTLGVILAATLLVPIIDNATTTTDTYTNDGLIHLEKYTAESDDITIAWTYDTPNAITINDETLTLPDVEYLSIDMGNDWFVRYNRGVSMSYLATNASIVSTVAGEGSLTVTLSGGTITATDGTTTKTNTYTEYLCITPDENASYVMKKAADSVYLKGDSEIIAYGQTSSYAFKIVGNVTDGVTVSQIRGSSVEIDNETVNATADDSHIDLYKFTSVTFTYGDATATYNAVVVPKEITAEKSAHLTDGQISLMGAIPIMVIVALLMAAVGAIVLRRND